MNRDELLKKIEDNLKQTNIEPERIIVRQDPYGGWRIAVVAEGFRNIPQKIRRQTVLEKIEEAIEWIELVTPEEQEWTGALPGDIEIEDLPLWPETLAKGALENSSEVVFPSDLDEDISPPIVTTFYSLRGGVGRSTALAYTAHILSANRRKVVCIDMDLEAPGLASLFACENEVRPDKGVVSLLMEIDQGEDPDFSSHLIPVPDADNIYLIPAGQISPDYARKLRFILPDAWYREEHNPLKLLLAGVKEKLPFTPDVILLDARTGITDINGPLLFDLADISIITFFPHPQARLGTQLLTQGLLASSTERKTAGQRLTPEPRFLISPLPNIPELINRYKEKSLQWIAEWMYSVSSEREDLSSDENELTHFVRYRDDIASSNAILKDPVIWKEFEPVVSWIERFLPSENEAQQAESLELAKDTILRDLTFAPGTAENQGEFLDSFVETAIVKDALSVQIPLVLGRKGSGKTAIFRRISEDDKGYSTVVVHAPASLKQRKSWIISVDGFQYIEKIINDSELSWRHFWVLYVNTSIMNSLDLDVDMPEYLQEVPLQSEREIIAALKKTAEIPGGSLELNDWLLRLDRKAARDTFLLLDGLDTGFGSAPSDRKRRSGAIEGLFDLLMNQGQTLQYFHFKILLREDIWRKLHFENKSHLYGRSVELKWTEQATFLKVILKQALRCKPFREFLQKKSDLPDPEKRSVDSWTEKDVFAVWNILVGERMQGGRTAFTRNWVWTRLADSNNDHTPRYLLQLFHEAVPWEQKENNRSRYLRALIRPRALIQCLPEVSVQALEALKEEFKELEPLLDNLKRIGRTPVAASDLGGNQELIPLAQEVGILSVYEERNDEASRYKIPDVYRHALETTHKGQA